MKTAIVNIGRILSGDLGAPVLTGDAILLEGGLESGGAKVGHGSGGIVRSRAE